MEIFAWSVFELFKPKLAKAIELHDVSEPFELSDGSDTESDLSTTFSSNKKVNMLNNFRQSSSDMGQGCCQSFFKTVNFP